MKKRLNSLEEREAWDRYFVAALKSNVEPGRLQGMSDATRQDALSVVSKTADHMMSERADRDPKKS